MKSPVFSLLKTFLFHVKQIRFLFLKNVGFVFFFSSLPPAHIGAPPCNGYCLHSPAAAAADRLTDGLMDRRTDGRTDGRDFANVPRSGLCRVVCLTRFITGRPPFLGNRSYDVVSCTRNIITCRAQRY